LLCQDHEQRPVIAPGSGIESHGEESLWIATIYDRVDAAEKLGWDFHPQDSVKRKEQE